MAALRHAIGPVLACAMVAAVLGPIASADAAKRTSLLGGLDTPGISPFNAPPLPPRPNCAGTIPDTTGAIGRRHYVEMVNACIAVYTRDGLAPVAEQSGPAFWGGPDPTNGRGMVDPQVVWDRGAHRWYVAMLNTDISKIVPNVPPLPGGSKLLFAWSKTADPTDLDNGWCKFTISTGDILEDFPNLGFSRRHIMIGTDPVDFLAQESAFARLWAIAKPRDGDTACRQPQISTFGSADAPLRQEDGRTAQSPVPVNPVRPGKRGWVIASDCVESDEQDAGDDVDEELEEDADCERGGERGKQITVWRLQGSRSSPRLIKRGAIDVPAFRLAQEVAQPGTDRRLKVLDPRLTQAVSNNDPTRGGRELVWTQHVVRGRKGRAKVRWYELDPRRLSVVRRGSISKRRKSVWNGAISPTKRGKGAVIQYNVGGKTLLPQIRASSRGARDGKRAMGGEIILGRSDAPREDCEPPPDACGWGDYAGATPDPRRPNVVWGSNMVAGPERMGDPGLVFNWLTRNFALRPRR